MGRHRGLLPSSPRVLRRRVRRLPRQLLRNLGLFYLVLAAAAGLLVLGSTRRDFLQEIESRARIGFSWVHDKGIQILPVLFNNLQLTTELSRSILAEGLPSGQVTVHATGSQLSPETLRSLVEAVTDYDLAEPESLVAGAFPGSRTNDRPLRWDWIIQRGIQGYSFPLTENPGFQTRSSRKEFTDAKGEVEVVITAPEYAVVAGDHQETEQSFQESTVILGDIAVVTYEAKTPQAAAAPAYASFSSSVVPTASVSPAERLAGLARVNWGSSPLIA
ncbi:MAG: hypothetical protein GX855_05565, partial [Firmicutes bacterium]|nr:hypothetical protein [Bacillota bacterium]